MLEYLANLIDAARFNSVNTEAVKASLKIKRRSCMLT